MFLRALCALGLAAAASASTIAVSGHAYVGSNNHHLDLSGPGLSLTDATPGWSYIYTVCDDWANQPCDLSYQFDLFNGQGVTLDVNYNGLSLSNNWGPQVVALGFLTWTAPPLQFQSVPNPATSLPVTLSGRMQAWTAQDWASGGPAFLDIVVNGTGVLQVSPWGIDPSNPPADLPLGLGDVVFTGVVTSVPEPAAGGLVILSVAALFVRWRRCGA